MNTKNKLKSLGAALIFLGLFLGILGPAIVAIPQSTSISASEQLNIQIKNKKRTLPVIGISGILFGAGIALLIVGYKRNHFKED